MRIQDITEATQDVAQQPQQQNLLKRLGGGITKKIGQATSAIGKAVSTGAGAVGQAAKNVGNELGNVITAKKMMNTWKQKYRASTDTATILGMLQDYKFTPQQIQNIEKNSAVDLDGQQQQQAQPQAQAQPQPQGTQ